MHSVMLLIVSFGALAGLYVLLDAPFTAVTQIIIYAGAIMVLFLFVVMLLNVPREEPARRRCRRCSGRRGCASARVLSVLLGGRVAVGARAHRPGLVHAAPSGRPRSVRWRCIGNGDFHAACVRVRSDIDPDPGRDDRRSRAGAEGTILMVPLNYYLILSGVLFAIGTAGVFLRRNLITVLLSIEIMLNAVNLTFVAVGRYRGIGGRADHHVLRHDRRRRRSGGRAWRWSSRCSAIARR